MARAYVRKGMFMISEPAPAGMTALERHRYAKERYPEFSALLDAVGPPPDQARLQQLDRERAELRARMAQLQSLIGKVRKQP